MALELKQNLKLTQQLVMTPQLQQAIKLLQLSRLEMLDMITQELEENPLLEEATDEETYNGEEEVEEKLVLQREHTKELTGEGDGRDEFDFASFFEDLQPATPIYERREDAEATWENFVTKKPSLVDHLIWQLRLTRFSEKERLIGQELIGNIDQEGYLRISTEEVAKQYQVTLEEVEAVLSKIQEFDPPGVGARDLKECLLIQARLLCPENTLVSSIIQDFMTELEKRDYSRIAKKLRCTQEEVMAAVEVITKMDPKPGSAYSTEEAQIIIPDVFVFKVGDEYKIILNDDGLPQLRINKYYRELLEGRYDDFESENGRRYLKEKEQAARWLLKSIQQRQRTIYRVTESILKFQREFFDKGIDYLKPLILRDIAEDVGMHESTISRVVTNKYMHSPRGIFELKYFFSSGLNTREGETIASKSVKEEIKKLIAAEDPYNPLSDDEITRALNERGIRIARRTVAKYRELMRILPSSRRKKYK